MPSTAPITGQRMPKLVFPVLAPARPEPVAAVTLPAAQVGFPQDAVAPTQRIQFPPVDLAVAAQAEQEMRLQAQMDAPALPPAVIAQPPSFVAPAPLPVSAEPGRMASVGVRYVTPSIAGDMPAPLPELVSSGISAPAVPLASARLAPLEQTGSKPEQLSDTSKRILSKIPSKLDAPKTKAGKLAINRMSPDVKDKVGAGKVESYDSVGISIKVQRAGLDTNFELNRAYDALMAGDTATAVATYKNILTSEPNNEDALFGAAATYHRMGNIAEARPFYGQLLKVNPNHREGLNNFLALIGDEAPQEALAELERLEQRNPEFSPIPAQQAILFGKLGYNDQARDKMLRAIELAPDNLTYRYNLAIMLDRQGNYADAGALYRMLIDAALNGQKIPASAETLQKRLNFIMAATKIAPAGT
ncbi:MAG: tetratricopeptide repeat protein [Rickettsiales bacterium]